MNFQKLKNIVSFTLIILVSSSLFQCTWMFPTAQKTNDKYRIEAPYDVIIVPGFPHDTTTWSQIVQMRVHWAKHLYQEGITKNIMFSGSAVYSPYLESEIMKKYAIALGIPEEHIFTESNARHSTENLYFSYTRAKELGFTKIALASDPFQTNNLRWFKKRWGIKVGLLPIIYKKLFSLDQSEPFINPSSAYVKDFVSIVDDETMAERINGTLGNNIRWKEEDLRFKRQRKRQAKRGMMIPKKD